MNSGWGGDRVTGGGGGPIATRLERDVIAHDPTVITIMLGMNDAAYRPYDEKTFRTFEAGYLSILDTLAAQLPQARLTLIASSPFDDVTRPVTFPGGYNSVVHRYGFSIIEPATKRRLRFVDFNGPVVEMLQKASATDPALAQKIIPDRVHPGPGGHLIMAAALLQAWIANRTVSEVRFDARDSHFVRTENTTVTDLVSGPEITWTQLDRSLPFPLDPADAAFDLALRSSHFMDAYNRQMLAVTGLPAPAYLLTIDDTEVGIFTAPQLAQGLNLATLPTPMLRQAARVAELTNLRNEKAFWHWRQIRLRLPLGDNPAIAAARDAVLQPLAAEDTRLVRQQRDAAQPVARRYRLTPNSDSATADLAFQKPCTSSHLNPMSSWNLGLTDGIKTGRDPHVWASDAAPDFPKYTTIDLGQVTDLGSVRVSVPAFGATRTVDVLLSKDGLSYPKVGTHTFTQKEAATWTCEFPAHKARYIRLSFPDHHDQAADYDPNCVFLSEVQAYAPAQAK